MSGVDDVQHEIDKIDKKLPSQSKKNARVGSAGGGRKMKEDENFLQKLEDMGDESHE
jgi:hypothetical protein